MELSAPPISGSPRLSKRWPLRAVLLCGFLLLTVGLITAPNLRMDQRLPVLAGVVGLAGVFLLGWRLRSRWEPALERVLVAHTEAIDSLPERSMGWWIALASGLGLFAELVLIRWHASTFQLFAYFKNVSLLAAFLGLGIGYACGRRRLLHTPLVIPAICAQFALLFILRFSSVQDLLQSPISDNFAFGLGRVSNLRQAPVTYGFLILVFTFTVLTCMPLGQLASRLMLRRPPLAAYGCNLLGSLVGICLFSLLGALWTTPTVWLMVVLAGILPFLALGSRWPAAVALASVGLALTVLSWPFRTNLIDIYSPYQILSLQVERTPHPSVQVNHVYYQRILNLSRHTLATNPEAQVFAQAYDWPYQVKSQPERVLVVGAGTGNDVAAALRNEAQRVDAVEIDPAILTYGKLMHPEQPYQDARVDSIVQDARTYLRQTDRQYDLIVYGLLDSHTLLSNMSSVRLDSFVYTVEGFRDARSHLTSQGVLSMTFCLLTKPMGRKFFLMLQEAFDGQEPRVFETQLGHIFVIGPGMPQENIPGPVREVTEDFQQTSLRADISTDDWPFLYMPVRKISFSCLLMVSILLLVSLLVLIQFLPLERGSLSPACYFLGAGFMLIETKGITELGLLFGNTFHVLSVVIAAILIMAFLANFLCQRLGTPGTYTTYGLLLGSVLLGLGIPQSALAGLPLLLGQLVGAGLIALPLFFSGLAFSKELKESANLPAALSCNLLGAMLGGFCEYNSMAFGFRSLSVVALVFYGLAFVATLWALRARSRFKGEMLSPSEASSRQAA